MYVEGRSVGWESINPSVDRSRAKNVTTTSPPGHQSQPTSTNSEGAEDEPSLLNKSIVYIHRDSSEKQRRLDAAWIHKDKGEEEEEEEVGDVINKELVYPSAEGCNRILSSAWQRESEDEEEEARRSASSAVDKLKRKIMEYLREWKDGIFLPTRWGVMEACVRVLCLNFVWCLALGTWLEQKTERMWGIAEVVIANAVCGSLFQLLGGQSLIIVGPSSPCLIFLVSISSSARYLRIDALSWMGWIGVWASLALLLLALSNASKLVVNHMTLFSWGVVCVFIRLTFLWGALEQLIHLFMGRAVRLDSALLSLWLATVVFFVSAYLGNAPRWSLLSQRVRSAVADYGMIFALLLFTVVSHLPRLTQPHISQVSLPEPGYHTDQTTRIDIITLRILPFWAILLSLIPGIMLAGMIFLYQTAMASLIQEKAGSIVKLESSQRWDLCILAFLTLFSGLFGLPFACGMSHQTCVHVRALTLMRREHSDMEEQRKTVKRVAAQRVSSMGAALLSVTFLLPPLRWAIARIPCAVLIGLLIQFALQNWGNWSVVSFLRTFLVRGRGWKSQERIAVCIYSTTQIGFILALFVVNETPAAVLFPLISFISLWTRHYAMRNVFRKQGFAMLDAKLYKDMSDPSGSSELSSLLRSPRAGNTRSHPTWPKFSIGEALKSHSSVPCVEAKAQAQAAEVCESPMVGSRVAMSPSLLFVSDRRLKERSRRRRIKKKRRACGEEGDSPPQSEHDDEDDDDDDDDARDAVEQCDHHDIGGIPPLIRAIMEEEEGEEEGAAAKQQPKKSNKHDEEINLSKRLSPGLSPKFFKRSKAGQESPLEVHSNLLYDPPPTKDRSKRVKKQPEEEDQGKKKPQNDGASTSAAAPENEIQSCGQAMVFQGSSPGIGRCVRSSPPAFSRPKKSLKRKQLHLSFAARDPLREEQALGSKSLHLHPKSPLLLYPRLRRSTTTITTTSTGKWAESPFHQPKSMDPSSFQATSISIL